MARKKAVTHEGNPSYAASSVIERGTATKIASSLGDKHVCACGCGETPRLAGSLFMPGHDSKARSMGKQVKEGKIKATAVPKVARQWLEQGGML